MDFTEAWDALNPGDRVSVTNGMPQPSTNTAGLPYRIWRSHNFEGALVEKTDGPPRAMRIALDPVGGVAVAYTVTEGVGHTFNSE